MQKYTKPNFKELDKCINPFSNSLQIPVVQKELLNQYKPDAEGILLPVIQEVEYTPYAKFYSSAERRIIRNSFSLRAKEMILWIMDEMEAGKDYIWINKKRYMDELNISSVNTFKDALKELIRYNFLAISLIPEVFWINPDFVFKGDRVKKYPKKLQMINDKPYEVRSKKPKSFLDNIREIKAE